MSQDNHHEPSLWELSAIIWKQKKMMLVFLCVFMPISLLYLHLATPRYSVNLSVYPVDENEKSVSSSLNSLSMLTGVTLGAESDQFDLYLAGLNTLETAQILSDNDEIMQFIFESEWDAGQNKWVEPDSFVSTIISFVKRLIGIRIERWEEPGFLKLQKFLQDEIVITKNADNSIVTLSLITKTPEIGVKILQSVHAISDNTLRQRAIINTNDNISYIENKLKEVTVTEYRQALIEILSSQEKQRMMAMSGKYYSGQPFDMPIKSLKPVSPSPVLVLIMTIIIAVFSGALFGVIREHQETNKAT